MKTESYEPTKHSHICADHFTADCFQQNLAIRTSLGSTFKPRRLNLKKDAVSMIFNFKKKRNICYSPAGRSVLGKTVLEVLDTARGRRPRAVLKTEGTVFPNTDRPRLVNNIFIFFSTTQRKACERPAHFRAVTMARFATN